MAGDICFLVGKGSDDFGRNPNTLRGRKTDVIRKWGLGIDGLAEGASLGQKNRSAVIRCCQNI